MRKKFLTVLTVCVAMMLVACGSKDTNDEKKDESVTPTEAVATTAPEKDADKEDDKNTDKEDDKNTDKEDDKNETKDPEFSCIGESDVPVPAELLGISQPFMEMNMMDQMGMVIYQFVTTDISEEDKASVLAMVPDYDGFVVLDDAIAKFDKYFTEAGYTKNESKGDEGDTVLEYTKDGAEYSVTITYNATNIEYSVSSGDSDIDINFEGDGEFEMEFEDVDNIEMEDAPTE